MAERGLVVSAPGKVILHGEHAVVHGKAALAVALGLRTFLCLRPGGEGRLRVRLPGVGVLRSWEQPGLSALRERLGGEGGEGGPGGAQKLLEALKEFAGIPAEASGPDSLAILAFLYMCLAISAKYGWTEEEMTLINSWAFQGERRAALRGARNCPAPAGWGGFLRVALGPASSLLTSRLSASQFPAIMNPVLDSIDAISQECQSVLEAMPANPSPEHYPVLEELFDINQHHLNVIGVGHPSLDRLCRVTASHGLHSKLTGAGGGGCGITLLRPGQCPSAVEAAKRDLCACGFECWETDIGAPGVTLHSSSSLKAQVLHELSES
uniref:mevalonate kinase n=1 Tax=Anas platyrhynchos TaxID=8839 RepID=A0A8B9TQ30_ANAPL